MIDFIAESPEVFYSRGDVLTVGSAEVAFLKAAAAGTPRLRSRVCLHAGPDALVHEMLIVHHRDAYVRPHRHPAKAESLTVIEGAATAHIFDDDGMRVRSFPLATPAAGGIFLYRIPPAIWHGLIVESDWFVFLETTRGPLDRAHGNEFARFAPDDSEESAVRAFMTALRGI